MHVRPTPTTLALASLLVAAALAGCTDDGGVVTHLVVAAPSVADFGFHVDVRSDLTSRPTQSAYDSDGIAHADGYTAHDQLADWLDQHDGPASFHATPFKSSFGDGYFLTEINGVEADGTTAYWSLSVNGEVSQVGMSEAILHDGDTVAWTYTLANASASSGSAGQVRIDPVAPTKAASVTLNGTVDHPVSLTVMASRLGADVVGFTKTFQADGAWTLDVPLEFGRNNVEAFDGDDGYANLTAVRLAAATFEAVYTASPGHEASSDEVWYDPDDLASAPMYAGTDTERATTFSVHDLMVTWTAQTGTPVEYGGPGAFGYSVNSIDGIGQPLDSSLPPYWCYTLNGETADLGISLQTVQPGDVVTWEYSTCV